MSTLQDLQASSLQPPNCLLIRILPLELHVNILTYLRAYDLSTVQHTCRFFASRHLMELIITHTAHHVYPPELTQGYDSPIVSGSTENSRLTYEVLRNMEMLVVARVLSRPEPTSGFYVSKSWCRTALKWLEVQQEESLLKEKKKRLSKKQQRLRNRRLSDASPPWPNVNSDICCEHSNLSKANNKSARAKRKVLDKQAWKVLKKLYPDSTQLDSVKGECLHCALEQETARINLENQQEKLKAERKRPLACPLVRAVYTRSRGVPVSSLVNKTGGGCPLQPGVYHVLPRAWCHAWRRYLKHGNTEMPCAPNATSLLCDAHRLPLIPPHLESYLYGETSVLLSASSNHNTMTSGEGTAAASMPVVGMNPTNNDDQNDDVMASLRAAGMSSSELASQRMAMMSLERNNHVVQPPPRPQRQRDDGELLDRENKVVVELLTQAEHSALEKWWPKSHSNFCLRFCVLESSIIEWSTVPCRECDASRHLTRSDLIIRNRARGWVKKSTAVKKAPASLEY